MAFAVAALLSLLVATAELVSRYRDAPGRLLKSPQVWLYCAVNAASSMTALGLARLFGWNAGYLPTDPRSLWTQVLAAAFASTVLLRSSIFKTKIGNQDVDIGPAMVLQQLLAAVERGIDRSEGKFRLDSIDLLQGLSFTETVEAAPELCAGVLLGLTQEQQANLRKSIEAIKGKNASDSAKLRLLALELVNVAGPEIVSAVARKLQERPKELTQTRP